MLEQSDFEICTISDEQYSKVKEIYNWRCNKEHQPHSQTSPPFQLSSRCRRFQLWKLQLTSPLSKIQTRYSNLADELGGTPSPPTRLTSAPLEPQEVSCGSLM